MVRSAFVGAGRRLLVPSAWRFDADRQFPCDGVSSRSCDVRTARIAAAVTTTQVHVPMLAVGFIVLSARGGRGLTPSADTPTFDSPT